MKDGDSTDGGGYPLIPSLFVEIIRHVLTLAVAIPMIWLVVTKTLWLVLDPVLWFSMMIIPTAPPATELTALAVVSGYSEAEEMGVSKCMAVSYAVSPVMAVANVGSFKVIQAAM